MSNEPTYDIAVKALSELSIDERIDALFAAIEWQRRLKVTTDFMIRREQRRLAEEKINEWLDGGNVVTFPKGGAS